MGFDWRNTYPGTRTVTLVLDAFEAEQLLDQAAEEGRLIGRDTVHGMPAIAFGPEIEECDDEEEAQSLTPDPKIVPFTGVFQERIEPPSRPDQDADEDAPVFDARSPLASKPPARPRTAAEPEVRYFQGKGKVKRGEITEADMALARKAVANGRVTRLPPGHARGDYIFNGLGEMAGKEAENGAQKRKRERAERLRAARKAKERS